ncbi:hypothetical protein FB451DRAFT_1369716 [Mycena latifolia]|nr:hypothetical protein FB451DRAFT_1369716 [Mycena latifolia]
MILEPNALRVISGAAEIHGDVHRRQVGEIPKEKTKYIAQKPQPERPLHEQCPKGLLVISLQTKSKEMRRVSARKSKPNPLETGGSAKESGPSGFRSKDPASKRSVLESHHNMEEQRPPNHRPYAKPRSSGVEPAAKEHIPGSTQSNLLETEPKRNRTEATWQYIWARKNTPVQDWSLEFATQGEKRILRVLTGWKAQSTKNEPASEVFYDLATRYSRKRPFTRTT